MFGNVRKCLNDFEDVINNINKFPCTREEEDILNYFDLHLAEALMKDCGDGERVAKIILAEKGLSEKVRFEFK